MIRRIVAGACIVISDCAIFGLYLDLAYAIVSVVTGHVDRDVFWLSAGILLALTGVAFAFVASWLDPGIDPAADPEVPSP